MNRVLTLLLLALFPTSIFADEPLSRIAFGSCAKEGRPQPIWSAVVETDPDLFLFLGDNIYGDTDDMDVMRAKYERLAADAGFQQLAATCPFLATWDDHDYGRNDAGVEYPMKRESQQVFLDFFSVPQDDPRRQRDGVYHAQVFGPEGKRVQIIMLDTRYHRSPLKKGEFVPNVGSYLPNEDPEATILGEEQWAWLAEQLQQPAEVRLIGSSIQVVPEDHRWEKWMNIPAERDRLFKLIRETQAAGVIFLSGDRHLAELSMMDGGVGYPLYDVTSSGLNQASAEWRPLERNRHRVGTMNQGNNFGLIVLDWDAPEPALEFQIRDEQGEITIRRRIALSVLQPGTLASANDQVPMVIEGVLTPAEAFTQLNAICTVELEVKSTGKSRDGGLIYLNSEADYRDENNFTVILVVEDLQDEIKGLSEESFATKTVRVTGEVSKGNFGPRLFVRQASQIQVVEPLMKE